MFEMSTAAKLLQVAKRVNSPSIYLHPQYNIITVQKVGITTQ